LRKRTLPRRQQPPMPSSLTTARRCSMMMDYLDIFLDPRFADAYTRHPLVLVDVGARGGLNRNWSAVRRHLRVIGFEPERQEFDALAARPATDVSTPRVLNVALHSTAGPVRFNVARDRGLSSVFEPNRPFLDAFPDSGRFDIVDVQDVAGDTLDHVVEVAEVSDVDFMKVDTQGSELLVLQGAGTTLGSRVMGVEVEVEFTPIYRNQPLFADVDAYLRDLGFLLFDLRPCYWKRAAGRAIGGPRGQIVWADALYLKSGAALAAMLMPLPADLQRSKLLKAISISLLYGYHDYALELARMPGGYLRGDDRRAIESLLMSTVPGGAALQKVPGRRHIASALHRLWKVFRQRGDDWSVSKPRLGNFG
jgi:FkbM family methyltransferase